MKKLVFRRKLKPVAESPPPTMPPKKHKGQAIARLEREHVEIGRRTWFYVQFHEVVEGATFLIAGEAMVQYRKVASLGFRNGASVMMSPHDRVLARFGDFNG